MDGNGYPLKKTADEIDLPARIVAVADVFTALREDRPYRPGLSYAKIEAIMKEEIASGGLDGEVVTMLFDCRQELDEIWSTLSLFGVQ